MIFNSTNFAVFFLIVYALYLSTQKMFRIQNLLLLVASYVFYGFWDWRFLFLLTYSTLLDFWVGRKIQEAQVEQRRKAFLAVSVVSNLAVLGFFKYFNFFASSFANMLGLFGFNAGYTTLNIILPVGISFYTFQTLSYTIDIYRGKLTPAERFTDFALFVAFFPQLVAGPIERAVNLLPQIAAPRKIRLDQVNAGIYLVIWGLFKKTVIADNLGQIADFVFEGYRNNQGLDLLIGVLAFTIQIYGDFSGYSDIARGIAKLLGFDLMMNFNLPYFALNPSDFWERWHISLSSWLRDYLYIPLGGNRSSLKRTYMNLMITMVLGGLWHGAAWNFVLWGGFHGVILVLYRLFEKNPAHRNPWNGEQSPIKIIGKMGLMFVFTLIGWVIFRSDSMAQIGYILTHISFRFSNSTLKMGYDLLFYNLLLIIVQVYQYISRDLLILTKLKLRFKIPAYTLLLLGLLIFGVRESLEFIYFQF